MRDLRHPDHLFGGVPVLLGGDFAQNLPVVRSASRAETVAASLQGSYIWPYLPILRLSRNMRLTPNPINNQFSRWLQQVSSYYYSLIVVVIIIIVLLL